MTSEVVLPSGAFASIRQITVADMVVATRHNSGMSLMVALAERVVTLDGEPVALEKWLTMDYAEIIPVLTELNKQLESAFKTKLGVI